MPAHQAPRRWRGQGDAAQLRECPGQLDAGGTAADHGDTHVRAFPRRAEPLQARHDLVAQEHGVAAGIEAEAVLGGAVHAVIGGGHPGREDQVVIGELAAVGQCDPPGDGIEARHIPVPEPRAVLVGEAPQRVGDVTGAQPGRGHLVEQRLERAVDVAVDQRH